MRHIFIIFSMLLAANFVAAQSIPGGDMETWRTHTSGIDSPVSVTAPVGWYGDDSVIIGLGQTFGHSFLMVGDSAWNRNLFREDSIVHSGSHAAKVMTMVQDTLLIPGVLTTAQTHVGITFTVPYITGISFSGGDAVSVKPVTVSAWVRYYPGKDSTGGTGIDSGTINVQALSLIGGKDSVIGTGTLSIGTDTAWTLVTVTVNYPADSTDPIDTMRIAFSSSNPGSALDSSTLYVDDVTMTSIANPIPVNHTGINTLTSQGAISVYPNPVSGELYLTTAFAGLKVDLYALTGKKVLSAALTGYDALDLSGLAAGLYFYVITDAQGNTLLREKLSVIR